MVGEESPCGADLDDFRKRRCVQSSREGSRDRKTAEESLNAVPGGVEWMRMSDEGVSHEAKWEMWVNISLHIGLRRYRGNIY